jgi:hypothetical protein
MNTSRRLLSGLILGSLSLVSLVGCSYDDSLDPGAECEPHQYLCQEGFVCAELVTGGNRCFGELVFSGEVTNTSDGSAVEGAQVMALNEEGIAVTDTARTDAMGKYDLIAPAKRNADGSPVGTYTLRAAAQDYQAFPSGVRVAVPIDLGNASSVEGRYKLDSALTDVGLIRLGAAERSSMSGTLLESGPGIPGDDGGVLVVASGANGAFSGLSDQSGNWTIFNLPAGEYEFRHYAVDVQNEGVNVAVSRDPVSGLSLSEQGEELTTVTGSVQFVNAHGGALTSVILVVADTFDPLTGRGEAPVGLRSPRTGSPDINGNFSISGVPSGRYVVLPAYENDDLVRDPNTDFVTIDVPAGSPAFKPPPGPNVDLEVTAALPTISPGADAPEAVTTKPMLVWGDDSSEDYYDVRVFDAFGEEVWNSLMLPGVSGSATASVQYAGPLEPGMYYQFRVTSWHAPGGKEPAPISATEDQRGLFYLPAP